MSSRATIHDKERHSAATTGLLVLRFWVKASQFCHLWLVLVSGTFLLSHRAYSESVAVSPGLAREVLPYAKLCENVYKIGKNPSAPAPEGWKVIDDSNTTTNPDIGLFKSVGFHATAYENLQSGEQVLVFEGTDGFSEKDWSHNLSQIGGQFDSAIRYTETVLAKHPDLRKAAGHSLGGGLAQVVAEGVGLNAYTFNTPGVTVSLRVAVGYAKTGDKGLIDKFEAELKFKFSQMAVVLYAFEGPKIASETANSILKIGSKIKEARQITQTAKGAPVPEYKIVNIVARLEPVNPLSKLFLSGLDYGSDFLIDLGLIDPLSAHKIGQMVKGLEKLSPPVDQVKKTIEPVRENTVANLDSDFYRPPKNNFPIGQCTWFVYGRIQESGMIYGTVARAKEQKSVLTIIGGNAKEWSVKAEQAGLETGTEPREGAIACWTEWPAGFGHVAFVEEVNGDQPRVTESNVPIPKTMRIVAMEKSVPLFPKKLEAQQLGEVLLGKTRPVQNLGDLQSAKGGWCQLVAEQEDFIARSKQLTMSLDKYMTLSEAKTFAPWAKRRYDSAKAEGNFTGIRLSPAESAYLDKAGLPNKYIYLSRDGGASTTPGPIPVAGSAVLKLRSEAGLTQPVVATVTEGTMLRVIEGPIRAGSLVWWKLTGQPGAGWAPTEVKLDTIFDATKDCPVEVTAKFLWFHGSLKAHGTFYVAIRENKLMEKADTTSRKIRDLPVGTENTVIGGPTEAGGRPWWNLVVEKDNGWAIVDRWGFTYPKE